MLVKVKRGWELPEHMATPEDVFHEPAPNRQNARSRAQSSPALRRCLWAAARWRQKAKTRRWTYTRSGEIRHTFSTATSRPRGTPPPITIIMSSARTSRYRGAPRGSAFARGMVYDRWHGRKRVRDRHRRSVEESRPGRAPLPPSLRRSVGDGRTVVGFPDAPIGRAGATEGGREIYCDAHDRGR